MKYTTLLTITYFLIVALLVFTSGRGNKRRRLNRPTLVIIFGLLFIVHAFKDYETFADLPAYIDGFNVSMHGSMKYVIDNGLGVKIEQGYVILTKLISSVSHSPLFFLAVNSFFILLGYFFVIEKYSVFTLLSIFVMFAGPFEQSTYVIRQHLAVSICMFSIPFVIQRKLLPFLLLIIIAFSVHQTALVFLPVYFLYGIKNETSLYVICLVLALALMVGFQFVQGLFSGVLDAYSSFLEETEARYHMAIFLSMVLLVRLFFSQKGFFYGGLNRFLSIVLFISVVIAIAGASFPMTGRINLYYTNLGCLFVPDTAMQIKNKYIRWCFCLICFAVYSILFFNYLHTEYLIDTRTSW